ncbi:MAG: hypothetical protein RL115_827 [Bacteroidota bacterium]|jgi:uncharacterized protein (DUF2141 family)
MHALLVLLFFQGTNIFNSVSHFSVNSSLKIRIENLESNKGHVLVSLFQSKEGFPDKPEKAVRKASITIKDNKAWVLFTGLQKGTYAAAILHDENDDLKMNTNFFGIPTEGYGFSKNVMGMFGAPSFSKASFVISAAANEITIRTKN